MSAHPILFIPGPVEVDDELRALMSAPLIGHRSQPAKDCFVRVCDGLKRLYRTEQHAFFENAAGTALMEAGLRNLVRRRSLHVTCGAFSERWAKIATAVGREPFVVEKAWGEAVTPDDVLSAVERAGPDLEAVCLTHCETSTGVLNPVGAIAAALRAAHPELLILVDAVTSVGGAALDFDGDGLDLAFAGTQKCLALPPGLVTFALSARAVARAPTVAGRGFLIDFAAAPQRFAAGETPATPCVPLVFALERQLQRIADEGLEARWARHIALRDRTLAWGDEHGFRPFVADGFRSPTVTTLCGEPPRIDAVVAAARAAGFVLGKGYGKLKDATFRVGHMGDHDLARLEALLDAISAA